MLTLALRVAIVLAALCPINAVADGLDIGATFTLLTRDRIPGFTYPAVPMCRNLDDLKSFTPAKLKFNPEHFCGAFSSGMKLKIIKKDGDYLCTQNAAAASYQAGNDEPACYWIKMSPLDAIGAPPQL